MSDPVKKVVDRARCDPDVLAVMAFGSRARGDATPSSDTDICLVRHSGSRRDPDLSRKRLDHLVHVDLDIQVFQQLPLYIRSRVLKDGRILFCRDEEKLHALAFRTARAFEYFQPYSYGYLEAAAHG